MKKIFWMFVAILFATTSFATVPDSITLPDVNIVSFYRTSTNIGATLEPKKLIELNHGQEPSFILQQMPSIYAYNDNGTNMGYSYFRLRGMGQERMNVTLDGMPWNEAEDFGCYFSNSPDLMSSMHSIKVERGASITNNGTAAYAGNVSLESVNLKTDTTSYIDFGAGSFGSARATVVYNQGIKNGWGLHVRYSDFKVDGYKEHAYNKSKAFTLKTGYFWDNSSIEFLSMSGYHRNGQCFYGVTEDLIPKRLNPFGTFVNGNSESETDNFFMTINKLQYKTTISDKFILTSSAYWNHLAGDYRILLDTLWNYDLVHDLYGANVTGKLFLGDFTLTAGINAYMFQRQHAGIMFPNDTVIAHYHWNGNERTEYVNMGYKPDVNAFITAKYDFEHFSISGNAQYRYTALHYRPSQAYDINDVNQNIYWPFFNYGASIEHKFNSNSDLYFRYVKTGKEPSRVDMFVYEYFTGEYAVNPNQIESVNDFELGYDIANSKLNYNVNLFYMDFKNELIASGELSPNNCLPLHEQRNAFRTGIESMLDWNITSNWSVVNNMSYEYDKIENGHRHTFTPAFTFFTQLKYKQNKYNVGTSVNYRSKMYMDLNNQFTLPAMFSLNVFGSYTPTEHIELSLILNNITNHKNISNGSVDGIAYYLIDAPFNFMLNAKYIF